MKILPSRMWLATGTLTTSTSKAATRPPPILRHSVWATTPLSVSLSMERIWFCRSEGNLSMTRSTAVKSPAIRSAKVLK
ncbi:MAG: hypothetical protein BWY98_01332 [Tenericutes bacterium ADurb.BinA155]|nr:MAG: hypothetical protein BWY98_01332 [Tenericutes bacterium ADurb.BinA155]